MTTIDLADLNRIAQVYGLSALVNVPTPWIGATSQVYPLHAVVLKVPFADPDAIAALKTDTAMAALMRRHGVQTPELLTLDESLDVLPVPFALYCRVPDAEPLSNGGNGSTSQEAWWETGRQLARVHQVLDEDGFPFPLRSFRQTPEVDPRPWVEELRSHGKLTATDAAWLMAVLEELAPLVLQRETMTLGHGDVNAANVLVHHQTGVFLALIDWAGAGWLDPAWDFAAVSLDVVPFLLAGHRSVAPLPDDHSAEARIFWCQVQARLNAARLAAVSTYKPANLDRDIRHLRRFATNVLGMGI